MPDADQIDHPGVLIQELESSAHTVVPGPSSTTVFIGRALRGPVNKPTRIGSFGDFRRGFGGLWEESRLGYAVADYFLNGGDVAIIVRLFNPGAADPAQPSSKAQLTLLDPLGFAGGQASRCVGWGAAGAGHLPRAPRRDRAIVRRRERGPSL